MGILEGEFSALESKKSLVSKLECWVGRVEGSWERDLQLGLGAVKSYQHSVDRSS